MADDNAQVHAHIAQLYRELATAHEQLAYGKPTRKRTKAKPPVDPSTVNDIQRTRAEQILRQRGVIA